MPTPAEHLSSLITHGDLDEPYTVDICFCPVHHFIPHVIAESGRACLACCLEHVAVQYGGKSAAVTREDLASITLSTVNKSRARFQHLRSTHTGPATTARQSEALALYERICAQRGTTHGVKTAVAKEMGISLQAVSTLLKRAGKA